jgi:hypothetical protein
MFLLHPGCDRFGGCNLSWKQDMFFESADSDDEFVRDLVEFNVLFPGKRKLDLEAVCPILLGKIIGLAIKEALQRVPVLIDLLCKELETLVT